MKVIVAGSRSINNYTTVREILERYSDQIDELICGGARGVDILAERWGQANNKLVTVFLAKWDKYGKSAGMIRNKEMAEYADYLIAIWDEQSKGTKGMIDIMHSLGKSYTVIGVSNETRNIL